MTPMTVRSSPVLRCVLRPRDSTLLTTRSMSIWLAPDFMTMIMPRTPPARNAAKPRGCTSSARALWRQERDVIRPQRRGLRQVTRAGAVQLLLDGAGATQVDVADGRLGLLGVD